MAEKKDGWVAIVDVIEAKLEAAEKMAREAGGRLRRLEALLKDKMGIELDMNRDGKIGSARIVAVVMVAAAMLVAGIAFAGSRQGGFQRPEDDSLYTWQFDSDGVEQITANEATDAAIILEADQGDDDADTWKVYIDADDLDILKFATFTSGAYVDVFELTTAGALTVSSTTAGSTNYTGGVTADVEITLTDTDGSATITATAFEASDAILVLDADEGDDAADTWTIESEATGNDLSVMNAATEVMNLTSAGALQVDAGVAAGDAVTLTDADGHAVISAISKTGAYNASIVLDADAGDDAADTWTVSSLATDNSLSIINAATEVANLTSAGALQIDSDLTVSGNDIDSGAATMTIGASAATRVEIGDTAIVVDIEGPLSAAETAALIGVATFTAQDIHNGGIDINEDVDIDMDAADEEVRIDQAAVAHTEAASFVKITDAATGATATETDEATLEVDSKGVYGISITDGALYVEGISTLDGAITAGSTIDADSITVDAAAGLDTQAAGTLVLGAATADRVEIGDTAIVIDAEGPLHATEFVLSDEVDSLTAATLLIGKATATRVELGDTAIVTETEGPLHATEFVLSDEVDSLTVTALLLGKATCNAVTIGASDITTSVVGPFKPASILTSTEAGATATLDSDDYGTIVMCTQAGGVTLTLPANGIAAGTWIDVMQGNPADNTTAITVEAAVADTLIGPNDVDLDSITFGAGHRIGGYARFISNGSFWMVQNLGGTTMTYTD